MEDNKESKNNFLTIILGIVVFAGPIIYVCGINEVISGIVTLLAIIGFCYLFNLR